HVIKNYEINAEQIDNNTHMAYGLFSAIGGDAVIENLGIENVSLRMGAHWVYISFGALTGAMIDNAEIRNCYSKNVSCNHAYSNGEYSKTGGLAGSMYGTAKIFNCYSLGLTEASGSSYFGGIVGGIYSADTSIQNCYSDTTIGVADAGAWGKWWNLYYPDTITLKWPWKYYSQNTPVGYIGDTQTVDELKAVPGNLKSAFAADTKNINGGYPVLKWQSDESGEGGEGETGEEILIGTAEELIAAANAINADADCGKGNTYKLTADIDLENKTWNTFIGTYNYETGVGKPFKGTFDGDGHVIKNYTVKGAHKLMTGLFGAISDSAVVKNVGVKNVSVIVDTDWVWTTAGGLVGGVYGSAQVTECYAKNVTMDITNYKVAGEVRNTISYGGGLVGAVYDSGTVRNCYALNMTVDTDEVMFEGGIAGYIDGYAKIENCYTDLYIAVSTKSTGASVDNSYYLGTPPWPWSNGADSTYVYKGTQVGSTLELKNLAPTLGEAFSIDSLTNTINDGYPVLTWEYNAPSLSGGGTEDMPYEIYTEEDLSVFATYDNTAGKYFKLMDDIDLGGAVWSVPVGSKTAPFEGIFNGNGHVIRNMKLKAPQSGKINYVGLFGCIGGDARIYDLGVENTVAAAEGEWGYNTVCGAVVGIAVDNASISRCYVKNNVFDNNGQYNFLFETVGALLGQADGDGVTVIDCYSLGTQVNNDCAANESGLIGQLLNFSSVANCYSDTTLSMCLSEDMNKVKNSYYVTETTGTAYDRAGTLAEENTLKTMASVLGGAYVNTENGYPVLVWETAEVKDGIVSLIYLDSEGKETLSISDAVSLKSVELIKTNDEQGRLFAAAYKDNVLKNVVICDQTVEASGKYNADLLLNGADTVKIFVMTADMKPLAKACVVTVP
ncbi:MAG: hypothetical protein PUD92_05050, partial [Clostridiales bacterium]|nr:hypothetical protein [Clostridiales bacterium]